MSDAHANQSKRRWSSYVCPDCRLVFRVPMDHNGRGVVCPGCELMLRIPTPEDKVPPLNQAQTIHRPR